MSSAKDDFVNGTAEIARNWRIPHKETRECLILYKSPWVKRQKRRDQKIQAKPNNSGGNE